MIKNTAGHFLSWDEAAQAGAGRAGGKGWNLGRLARFDFVIPAGGVLNSDAFDEFIRQNNLNEFIEKIAGQVTLDNIQQSDQVLNEIKEKIITGSVPPSITHEVVNKLERLGLAGKAVAVRSSASAEDSDRASFAGIHESFLNVYGEENIMEAVRGCYASLWTPQAVAYRRKLDISDHDIRPAVVIMEMVDASAAGVAFTCDPHSGRQDVFTVNANFGLGESVVSGALEPDTYYLDVEAYRAVPRVTSKKIGSKEGVTRLDGGGGTRYVPVSALSGRQVLKDREIEKLGLLLLRVFEALGDCERHQDVEWAYDGREFFLLQARPVTAMPYYTFAALKNKTPIWSNGNYREAAPMVVSPLQRRLMKNIIDTSHFYGFSSNEYPMPEGFQFSHFFNGRLYCDMTALQWANYDCSGAIPRIFNDFWGGHQPEIDIEESDPFQGETGQERQRRGMKGVALVMEAAANAAGVFAGVSRSVQALSAKGFEQTPDSDFIHVYNALGCTIKDYMEQFSILSAVGSLPAVLLLQKLYGYCGTRAMTLLNGLMVGGEAGITSADHGYRLIELAELAREDEAASQYLRDAAYDPLAWEAQLPEESGFKQAFRAFLQEYGHRAVYELDIINPRWKEDPAFLLDMIRSMIDAADSEQQKARQKEKFDRAWREIAEKIPADEQEAVRLAIKEAQAGAAVREMTKSVLVAALEPYRLMALEIGRRFARRGVIDKPDDIFYCSWADIFSILNYGWEGLGLKELVASRKMTQKEKEGLAPPDIIRGEEPVFSQPVNWTSGHALQGVAAAAGKASGTARLIAHPGQSRRLQPGEILVAPSTDPAWTPLFLKAGGVVMETGGFLSHGAIVAREYGVPAVVNVAGVMSIIKDGQNIVVDGDEGKILLGC